MAHKAGSTDTVDASGSSALHRALQSEFKEQPMMLSESPSTFSTELAAIVEEMKVQQEAFFPTTDKELLTVNAQSVKMFINWKYEGKDAIVGGGMPPHVQAALDSKGVKVGMVLVKVGSVGGAESYTFRQPSSKPSWNLLAASPLATSLTKGDYIFQSSDGQCREMLGIVLAGGRWYLELQKTCLQQGKLGLALHGASKRWQWFPKAGPAWPDDCIVSIYIDLERGEVVQRVQNGATKTWGPPVQSKIDGFKSACQGWHVALAGKGYCSLMLRASPPEPSEKAFLPIVECLPLPSTHRLIRALLSAKGSPSAATADSAGLTPLHLAARAADARAAELLCISGADPNAKARAHSRLPIHMAAEQKNLALVTALVLGKADVNRPDPQEAAGQLAFELYAQRRRYPRLALHTAVETGSASLVELLVAAKANVNAPMEHRKIVSQSFWLPLPHPPTPEAHDQKDASDPYTKPGKAVAITLATATALLRAMVSRKMIFKRPRRHQQKQQRRLATLLS